MNASEEFESQPLVRKSNSGIILSIFSGILLGVSFPPSPFYILAYFAYVPALFVIDKAKSTLQILRNLYLTFLVFHIIALYWIGGFTHMKDLYLMIAGAAVVIFHPLFFWLPLLIFLFIRKQFSNATGLILFPFIFVAFEYFHAHGEFSFPWLTFGNSQAYDIFRIQIAEYASVYGLSFILYSFNVLVYFLFSQLIKRTVPKRTIYFSVAGLFILFIFPLVFGSIMLKNIEDIDNRKTLKVALIQPNIDPFEKWGAGTLSKWESFNRQFEKLLNETKALKKENVNLVVWPETAIPFYLLLPQSEQYYQRLRKDIDSLQIGIFTGIPHAEFVDEQNASVTADRIPNTNIYYETYNSAILIQPKVPIGPIYKKVILVPYAERVPHAELFKFLIEPLKWSVGISSWGKGMDTVVFVFFQKDSMKFSGMICYESVYPHFVREFSKRGAEFLTIITNDSWYGNTSGPYQHSAYASFRAVENRKWIIRCANGGISGFIDPTGRIHQQSTMYQSIVLIDNIIPNNKSTFYIKFGDVFAQFCFGVAGMGLICAGIFWITRKGKKSYG